MMRLKKHRAVGGLISLIGLIVVFGVASVAFLELSSSQTSLINTSFNVNQKISDKNNQRLSFSDVVTTATGYTVDVENLGSESITIHSQITEKGNNIFGKEELNTKILAGSSVTLTITLDDEPVGGENTMFVTTLGKKCLVPVVIGSTRLCQ
jgi:hypothetical protein